MKMFRTIIAFGIMMMLIAHIVIAPRGATVLLLGDADGDGMICITDATVIQRDAAKIVKKLADQGDVTEQLKAENQVLWVRRINNIRNRALEIINLSLWQRIRQTIEVINTNAAA
jgi:hypothetical protein